LISLRENAFRNTDFPFIISIQNFCRRKQQKIIVDYLKNILIDIYIIDDNKINENYLSPMELRYKFIINENKYYSLVNNYSNNIIKNRRSSFSANLNNNTNPFTNNINLNVKSDLIKQDNTEESIFSFWEKYMCDPNDYDDLIEYDKLPKIRINKY
jgi:hypothetical protein